MDRKIIDEAYNYCEAVTRRHAKSFYFAARFLPADKRRAIYPIYAFCRHVDDVVDEADGHEDRSPRDEVAVWESRLRSVFRGEDSEQLPEPTHQDQVFIAFRDVIGRFRFDENLSLELIRGVVQDTEINRYETFDDLYRYCFRVASTVGLMSAEILGYSDSVALEHAEALGVAMQLTNIARDVSEDAARNRIYLPQEELERFGVSEAQILERRFDDRFRDLMKFQVARAREYYRRGNAGIGYLSRDSRFTVDLASTIYERILTEIERLDCNVFLGRAHTNLVAKLLCVPGAFRRTR